MRTIAAGVAAGVLLAGLLVHFETGGGSGAAGGGASASAHGKKGGWRWLPWGGGGAEDDRAAREARLAKALPAWKGAKKPVEIHVTDDEGRAAPGVRVAIRVDRYEYAEYAQSAEEAAKEAADEAAGVKPTETPETATETAAEQEESTADDEITWVEIASVTTGRDGIATAEIAADVGALFVASDRDGRSATSPVVRVYTDESEYDDDGKPIPKPSAAPTPTVVSLVLEEPATIVGVVRDDRGAVVPGAEIYVTDRSDGYEGSSASAFDSEDTIVTADDGSYRVPLRRGGLFDLSIDTEKYRSFTKTSIQVLPGREVRVDVTLQTGVTITGIVLGPDGSPASGASVSAEWVDASSGEGDVTGSHESGGATAQQDGTFTIEKLENGTYDLTASKGGFLDASTKGIRSGAGNATLRLGLAATIVCELTVARAALVEAGGDALLNQDESGLDAPIYLRREESNGQARLQPRGDSISIDANGHGETTFEGIEAGTWSVAVQVGGRWFASGPVVTVEGRESRVFIDGRGAGGTIEGVVTAPAGQSVVGGRVWLAGVPMNESAELDAWGRFSFAGLADGNYTLSASPELTSTAMDNSTVRGSSERVTVVVSGGGTQRVTIPTTDDVAASVALRTDAEVQAELNVATANDDGSIEPAEGSGPVAANEQYQPALLLDYQDIPTVLRAPPAPRGSKLYAGDHVIEADGVRWSEDDPDAFSEHLLGPKGTSCRLTVERPATGEHLTVSIERTEPVGGGEVAVTTREGTW